MTSAGDHGGSAVSSLSQRVITILLGCRKVIDVWGLEIRHMRKICGGGFWGFTLIWGIFLCIFGPL